ncbi:hypothetical protein SAMN02745126_05051 [Enhydrobacter aerosaccus]|uniref:SpoIIAA-like n=1 Tax=Enhydrobacter aerosaccus TaxID=225324 RepID=A0A1T4SRP1_9HYPH|nr:hypothetical protein [Enhydrobacter aerosaccus]SKA30924.1 hypothetical protein SAMN02745126_05051 [Enhydrobacter aerosaccus]
MPLHSTFSHPLRLVITVAKGDVLPREMLDYLGRLDASGARPYRKIFDVTALEMPITSEAIRNLASIVRAREAEGPVGPVAIVVGTDSAYRKAQLFVREATMKRPIKVFREQHQARKWLDSFEAAPKDGNPDDPPRRSG